MTQVPPVSVIIPVFNSEATLRGCLESVLSQTLRDIEVICVDDGSTDGSGAILSAYAAKDARVKTLRQANAGAGAARNAALDAATGGFVAFMDADDRYPEPSTLERMYREAKESDVEICGGGIELVTPGGVERSFSGRYDGNAFAQTKTMDYADYQFDFGFTRFIYSRELLNREHIRFPNLRFFEDPPFMVRAMSAAGRFRALDFPTYSCRQHGRRTDWTADGCRKVLDLLEGLRTNLAFAKDRGFRQLREYSCLSVDWIFCTAICRGLMAAPRVRAALDAVEAISGYKSRPSELAEADAAKRVRIFMVYHKPSPRLEASPFEPIQVGPAPDIPDVVCRDDIGENIAAKNPNFCELTAQYWIWKNVRAPYVGLMHYRRLLSFTKCDEWTFRDFSEETRARFGWNARAVDALLNRYDILLPPDDTVFPPGERGHVMTPYEFHCREHRKGDIDAALSAIHDLTPEFDGYARKALCEDTHECFGNVCVMRKDLFDSYSEWLFKILFEVERRVEIPKNREEARLFGFLSERLVMVWLGYARERLGARVWHSPSMPFGDFGEDIHPPLAVRSREAVAEPKVSVVIPVYNTARYLPMCLNSVCGQCLDEIEIICVDDGSTDGSAEILGAAAERDRRIRVVKGEHRGPGAARNRGIAEAKGKYLAFVDSDDWVDRFIWFRTVRRAEVDDLDLVLFEVEKVDDETGEHRPDEYSHLGFGDREEGVYHGVFTWRDLAQNVFETCCYPVNRLVRRDLWGDKRFPEDVVMGEDLPPHVATILEAKRVGQIRCPFYLYRQRPGSSMSLRGERAFDHMRNAGAVLDYLERDGLVSEHADAWPHFVYAMLNWTLLYWPGRDCFRAVSSWFASRERQLAGARCFGLRLAIRLSKTGSYPLFRTGHALFEAYRTVKDHSLGFVGKVHKFIERRMKGLFSRHG